MSDNIPHTHPSYGMLGFSRVHSPGGATLFGSSVPCTNFIRITLKKGVLEDSLHHEFFYGKEILAQVDLSPAQFAEAITCMNNGDGSPCTIRFVKGENAEIFKNCPYEPRFEQYERDFDEKCTEINETVNQLMQDAANILSEKTVKKSDIKILQGLLSKLSVELNSNLSFVRTSFDEYLNKSVSDAKQEIDAFLQHRIMAVGAMAIQNSPELLTEEPISADQLQIKGDDTDENG